MEPLTDQLPVPAVPTMQAHDEGISYSKKNRETLSFAGYTGPRIKIPETLLKDGRLSPIDSVLYQHLLFALGGAINKPLEITLSTIRLMTLSMGRTRQTISQSLDFLRACRWIALYGQGQKNSKIWILFDSPLSIDEMLMVDQGYLDFLIDKAQRNDKTRLTRIAQQVMLNDRDEFRSLLQARHIQIDVFLQQD